MGNQIHISFIPYYDITVLINMAKLILIAKKRKVVCEYWSRILTEANYQTVLCWTTTNDVLQHVSKTNPDLLLIETEFADGQGFEVARQAMIAHPALRCIMSLPTGLTYYSLSIQIDISGYLPENVDDPVELLHCLDQISQGYRYISSVFWGALGAPSQQQLQLINGLSERKKQVLRLVAKGYTARQIALEINIAEATARHHKEEISRLLGLEGAHQLKIFAGSIAHLLG